MAFRLLIPLLSQVSQGFEKNLSTLSKTKWKSISKIYTMNTEYYYHTPFYLLKIATAFLITVAFCMFFLKSIEQIEKLPLTNSIHADQLAMLNLSEGPNPPREPLVFVPERLCMAPEMQWAMADARCLENGPVIPDGLTQKQKRPFQGIIVHVAKRYDVDPALVRAIIFAESSFNPKAKSNKGARGLMQLMPSTAKALGVEDIYDPVQNIDGGVRYFKSLLDRFDGNVQFALAAYNAGSRHVRNYEGVPPFKATRRYVKKVLKFRRQFKMETASLASPLVLNQG